MTLILCGKSCSGKDTIRKNLVEYNDFNALPTITTRPKRDNEVDGIDYNFVTIKEFESMIHEKKIIEYRRFDTLVAGKHDTWYYGTPKSDLDLEKDYVIILDPKGARIFMNYYGKSNCCLICIEAEDTIRESRAKQRPNFDAQEWERRLHTDNIDFASYELYDIISAYITNDFTVDMCTEKVLEFYHEWRDKKDEEPN